MDEENQYQDTVSPDEQPVEDTQAPDTAEELAQARAEAAKYKAIAERKEKQLEKAQKAIIGEEPKPRKVESNPNQIEELNFKIDHPELKPHLDLVRTVATLKGISLEQAAGDDTVKRVLDAETREKGVSVINSNNKIATPRSEQIKDKQKVIDVMRSNPGMAEDVIANYLSAQRE